MNPTLGLPTRLAVLLAFALTALRGTAADAASVPSPPPPGFKLLFTSPRDLTNTWGQLHFGASPVRNLREIPPPDFTFGAGFARPDGAWDVLGQRMKETTPGKEPWQRVVQWQLVRAVTRDGIAFADPKVVFEQSGPWTDHLAIARNGDTGEFLALKLKVDDSGFAYTAFFSPDGERWAEHPGNPLFYDGDSMSLFWSPPLHRFICFNKSLQPHRKHFPDHGGTTPSLGDDSLRDRRVLMLRTSPDGRRWEPSVSLPDVWNRHRQKAPLPAGFVIAPDAEDPPDLEFYSGNGFWYHDRAWMLVLNYAASPLKPRQHGPHLDNEWWTSADGLRWERPARGMNALDVFPQVPRLETAPLVIGGQVLFPRGNLLLGLPEDRLGFVAARANAEFSTRTFPLPATDLVLNAAVPSPERPFAREQAYIRVALEDEQGRVIPGFEADRCVLRDQDRRDLPLRWGEETNRPAAGTRVRLRFHCRSATLYAVTAPAGP